MAAQGKNILCIDTDMNGLTLCGALLEDNGYKVLAATCGREGLQLFVSHAVDVILLEYYLGLLDGGVVANEIKRAKPETRVVMLTDQWEVPHDVLKSVDALVFKSHGPAALLAALHAVLEVSSGSKAAVADCMAGGKGSNA